MKLLGGILAWNDGDISRTQGRHKTCATTLLDKDEPFEMGSSKDEAVTLGEVIRRTQGV